MVLLCSKSCHPPQHLKAPTVIIIYHSHWLWSIKIAPLPNIEEDISWLFDSMDHRALMAPGPSLQVLVSSLMNKACVSGCVFSTLYRLARLLQAEHNHWDTEADRRAHFHHWLWFLCLLTARRELRGEGPWINAPGGSLETLPSWHRAVTVLNWLSTGQRHGEDSIPFMSPGAENNDKDKKLLLSRFPLSGCECPRLQVHSVLSETCGWSHCPLRPYFISGNI